MGGAGHHCHCKASNFCPHDQVLPGAQTIKIHYVFSDVGKFIRIIKNLPQNLVKNVRLPTCLNYKWLPGITKQEGRFNQNQQAYAI